MIRKCMFPVGGYGTRFLPATKALPKEMLPVVNKPLVQYGVEESIEAGLNEIGFVTGRGKRAIADHFDISYELEHQINGSNKEEFLKSIRHVMDEGIFSFTRQKEMKGLGHAILCGETLIGNEPFGVILADDLCVPEEGMENVLAQMVKVFNQFRCSIVAVMEVPEDEIHKYGVIEGDEMKDGLYRVKSMVEKTEQGRRAVQPGRHRALYPDTGYFRDSAQHTAGQERRGAAHRRSDDPGAGWRGNGLSPEGQAL